MASSSSPRILTFLADASITKGKAVIFGSDKDHVAIASLNTARAIGIAQSTANGSGSAIEVALQGGGAKMLLSETVVAGNSLVPHTDGTGALPNTAGDWIIAQAMQGGAAGDIIGVEVVKAVAAASE